MAYYKHKRETWDAVKCAKLTKHIATDGLGTPYPFPGYLGSCTSIPPRFGKIEYNGGCSRNGRWYQGEFFPLPKLAAGFKIVYIPTRGYQIRRKDGSKRANRKSQRVRQPGPCGAGA